MKGNRAELNRFLVEVFDEILKTEEESLAGSFSDLSLRELHLIECAGRRMRPVTIGPPPLLRPSG